MHAAPFPCGLRRRGIKQRMTGDRGWKDNVITERFIWSLKNECTRQHDLETGSQIRALLARYVDYYDFVREHSKLQKRTPAEAHGLSREKISELRKFSGCCLQPQQSTPSH